MGGRASCERCNRDQCQCDCASLSEDIYDGVQWHLTTLQVRRMADGETTRFLCIDSTFEDLVYSGNSVQPPEIMFRCNHTVEFTKVGGLESISGTFNNVAGRPFDFSTDGTYWAHSNMLQDQVKDDYLLGLDGPLIRWDTITAQFPLIRNDL